MIIRTKKSPRTLGLDEPIRHESHKAPVTRRDFIAQGFKTGPAIIAAPARRSRMLIGSDKRARACRPTSKRCWPGGLQDPGGAGKIPFICFDLAGGANLTGSEMLIGAAAVRSTSCPRRATPRSACRAT